MKYNDVMNHLEVTDDMKEEILSHLDSKPASPLKKGWVKWAAAGCALLLGVVIVLPMASAFLYNFGSKSSASSYATDSAYEETYDSDMVLNAEGSMESAATTEEESTTALPAELSRAKRIYRSYVSLETRDFDQTKQLLSQLTSQNNGFIASESFERMSNEMQYGSMECRIPTDQLDAFLDALPEAGTITSSSKTVENITRSYYQTAGRIESLEKERDRLNDLMLQAEDVSDLIAIQSQLSSVEEDLQWYQNDLSAMDLDLEYSTVSLYIQEVQVYTNTSPSFLSNLGSAFLDTWYYFFEGLGGIILSLVYLLPWILLLAAAFWAVRFLIKKRNARTVDRFEEACIPEDALPLPQSSNSQTPDGK